MMNLRALVVGPPMPYPARDDLRVRCSAELCSTTLDQRLTHCGLGTTPNWLLGLDGEGKRPTKRTALLERLATAARELSDEELRISVIQAEALVRAR